MAGAVDIEKRDGVAVLPPSVVETMAEARADGERVEADVVIEEDVRATHDSLAEGHLQVHQLGCLDDLQAFELRAPGIDVLAVKGEQRRDSVIERLPEACHDAAVEEDAVGERVDEDDPQPSQPRVTGARSVDCHDGR